MFGYLQDNRIGGAASFKTAFDCGRKGSYLTFSFDCENSQRFSAYSEDNEPIYLGDVVEIFIGVGENPKKYFELEVAPNGTKFFAGIHNDGELKVKLLEPIFKAEIENTESGYRVSISLPESAIGVSGDEKLYFNAFRIETEGGETEKYLQALSPTYSGSFHVPKFFIPFDED